MRAGFPKEFLASDRRGEIFTRLSDSEAGGAGGIGSISFLLPLNDLGNGIVNTVPVIALGSATPTFTRASVAWAKMASGLWGPVATGIARATYLGRDTAIGAYGGYWSEPTGAQLVTPTAAIRDMTDPSWVAVGITPTKTATGIDGVPNSCTTLTCTAPNGTILQTLVAAATARTYSVFLRRVSGSGTIVIQQGATTLDVTAQLNSVTKTRVQLNASVLNAAYGIIMGSAADVIEADVNQFEALVSTQFATSPMASTGAARAGDTMTFALAGNMDVTQGTAYAELSTNYTQSGGLNQFALSATSNGRMLSLLANSIDSNITMFDGVTLNSKTALTNMSTAVRKRASSWGAAGQQITGDGLIPQVAAFDGTMGAGPNIEIGFTGAGNQWSGTIRNVQLFSQQIL
jgi:hypothetical protein